jgi:hypothetical protein
MNRTRSARTLCPSAAVTASPEPGRAGAPPDAGGRRRHGAAWLGAGLAGLLWLAAAAAHAADTVTVTLVRWPYT